MPARDGQGEKRGEGRSQKLEARSPKPEARRKNAPQFYWLLASGSWLPFLMAFGFWLLALFLIRDLQFDVVDLLGHVLVLLAVSLDRADGVEHGRVVAAAEVAADLLQAVARVSARQVHADLPRERDALVAL